MPSQRHTAVIWATPRQAALARAVAEIAGLELVAAGSPIRGQSGAVASALGCEPADDLRAALAGASADAILILAAGDFGAAEAPEDARAVAAAASRGVRVLSLEPVPSNALDLEPGGWIGGNGEGAGAGPAASVRTVGLPRLMPVFREAAETLAAFGPVRTVLIEHWSAPQHASLAARLVGAIDLVHWLLAETESIDAVFVPGAGGPAKVSERTLLEYEGDLNAMLRTVDGRSALIAVSNAAARWNLTVTLLGEQGRLRFFDDGFEWLGPDGAKRDDHRSRTRGSASPDHAASVIADSVSRLLDDRLPDPGPLNTGSVLAVAHAAMLSARTRHAENPAMIRRMMSVQEGL